MDERKEESGGGYGKGYGKRPLWQWIVIYLIIAVILYGVIYYFFIARRSTSPTPAGGSTPQTQNPIY